MIPNATATNGPGIIVKILDFLDNIFSQSNRIAREIRVTIIAPTEI